LHERTDKAERERLEAELALLARCVSHDLRQPLHVISGYVELISYRYRATFDAKGAQLVDKALEGVQRMNDQIDALVGLMRLDARIPHLAGVDVAEVFAQACARLGPEIDAAGAVIEHGPLPAVCADPGQLELLFEHLLRNVLRFPGDGPPRARLDAAEIPGAWRFGLRDRGNGVDPRLHGAIFEPFGRGLDPRGGTGMGLAICRKVVALHGGEIGVESEPGKGSLFWFTLPR